MKETTGNLVENEGYIDLLYKYLYANGLLGEVIENLEKCNEIFKPIAKKIWFNGNGIENDDIKDLMSDYPKFYKILMSYYNLSEEFLLNNIEEINLAYTMKKRQERIDELYEIINHTKLISEYECLRFQQCEDEKKLAELKGSQKKLDKPTV